MAVLYNFNLGLINMTFQWINQVQVVFTIELNNLQILTLKIIIEITDNSQIYFNKYFLGMN